MNSRAAVDSAAARRLRIFEQAMVKSPTAIAFTDLEGRVTEVNPAFLEMFGFESADEVVGRPNYELDSDPDHVHEIMRCLREHGLWVGEVAPRRRDGTILTAQASATVVEDEDGNPLGLMASLLDVTAQRHAQKMEAVGRLAGGIAHDFNNLLMGIVGCCRIVRDDIASGDGEGALSTLDQIIDSAERGTKVTRKLLDFSRKSPLRRVTIVLDDLVRDAVPMLRHLLGEDVRVELDLACDGATILADESQVEQMLMNLVANSRDAMPRGGVLEITTHRRTVQPDGKSTPAPGDYVVIAVKDDGMGMDATTLERVFEPFFTTKEAGRGTGLGLASVFGIIAQLGGHVDADSAPGEGATFRLWFPVVEQAPALPADKAPSAHVGRGTVLVVEDELLVRLSVCHYLEGCGYTVLEAEDAAGALALWNERGASIALVVTDMVLPGERSGRELVAHLRESRGDLPAIYMSAYPADLLELQGRLEPGAPSLEKPFSSEALLTKVAELLGDAEAEAE